MATHCEKCGVALGWLQRLGGGYCSECQAEINRAVALKAKEKADKQAALERAAHDQRYREALAGEATQEDLQRLEADGYLIAGNRLIRCPICEHDRFAQQRTLLNTRAASFFNLDWANAGADTRICQQCTHILWFARE